MLLYFRDFRSYDCNWKTRRVLTWKEYKRRNFTIFAGGRVKVGWEKERERREYSPPPDFWRSAAYENLFNDTGMCFCLACAFDWTVFLWLHPHFVTLWLRGLQQYTVIVLCVYVTWLCVLCLLENQGCINEMLKMLLQGNYYKPVICCIQWTSINKFLIWFFDIAWEMAHKQWIRISFNQCYTYHECLSLSGALLVTAAGTV